MPRRKGDKTSYERLLDASTAYPLTIGEGVDRVSRPRDTVYSIALTNDGHGALQGLASTGIGELQRHEWELRLTGESGSPDGEIIADIASREAFYEVLNLQKLNDVVGIIVRHHQLDGTENILFPSCEVNGRILVSFARATYPDCNIPTSWDDSDYVLIITEFVGQRGMTGAKGDRGNDGAMGTTGQIGPIGPIGPSGTNGTNGTNGDCADCVGAIDPPPPGSRPPGMPPTDAPPPVTPPDGDNHVALVCANNPVFHHTGTNHQSTLADYGLNILLGPLTLLPVNDQFYNGEELYTLINTAIANSGLLPAGRKVTTVDLGYSFICTLEVNYGFNFKNIEVLSWEYIKAHSILPYLIANNNGKKIDLPDYVPYKMFKYKLGVEGIVLNADWLIAEAKETQVLTLSEWQSFTSLKLFERMLPALPNIFGLQITSPAVDFCLLGFTHTNAMPPCTVVLPYSFNFGRVQDGGLDTPIQCWGMRVLHIADPNYRAAVADNVFSPNIAGLPSTVRFQGKIGKDGDGGGVSSTCQFYIRDSSRGTTNVASGTFTGTTDSGGWIYPDITLTVDNTVTEASRDKLVFIWHYNGADTYLVSGTLS